MTAFTRATAGVKGQTWTLEIRSLNHRYFEFSFKGPSSLYAFESDVKALVQESLRRGKVSLVVTEQREEDGSALTLNKRNVEKLIRDLRKAQKAYKLSGELTISDVAALPRVFTPEEGKSNEKADWKLLEKDLKKTLASMVVMKEQEGRKLSKDIDSRLHAVSRVVKRVEKLAAGNAARYLDMLRKKIARLLDEGQMDEDKLAREAAMLAERSDITEEIVRLNSHIDLFRERLGSAEEIGRELDFLCQEMNREINTMGSKSQFLEISTDVIFMKKELEKIREQVQNIE